MSSLGISPFHPLQAIFVIIIALSSANSVCASGSRLPRFHDFRVQQIFRGRPAAPIFDSDEQWPLADERSREVVQIDYVKGPNFAGRYTVSEVSCGSGCVCLGVIDAVTGKIFASASPICYMVGPYQNKSGKMFTYSGASYRVNSRLLIVGGCFDAANSNPGPCEERYYTWERDHFKMFREAAVPQPH